MLTVVQFAPVCGDLRSKGLNESDAYNINHEASRYHLMYESRGGGRRQVLPVPYGVHTGLASSRQ
jgi:hypothetical protein